MPGAFFLFLLLMGVSAAYTCVRGIGNDNGRFRRDCAKFPLNHGPIKISYQRCSMVHSRVDLIMGNANGNESEFDETKQSDTPFIVRGSDDLELSEDVWEDIETGQPPKWLAMKELLGVNIFTYFLAGSIAFFLTANFLCGPGWLGQTIGLQGTGTFSQVSDSLPDSVNLNNPEYFLP